MPTFLGELAKSFLKALEPIASAARRLERLRFELATQGWAVDSIAASDAGQIRLAFGIVDLFEQAEAIAAEFESTDGDEVDIARRLSGVLGQLITAFRAVRASIDTLPYPLNLAEFWTEFGRGAIDGSIARFLQSDHPVLYGVMRLAGLLDFNVPALLENGRTIVETAAIRWDRLQTVGDGPAEIVDQVYHWNHPNGFDHVRFQRALLDALSSAGISSRLEKPAGTTLDLFYGSGNPARSEVRELVASLVDFGSPDDQSFFEVALAMLPIPAIDGQGPPVGWSLRPVITGTFPGLAPEADDGVIGLEGGFATTAGIRLDIRPGNVHVEVAAAVGNALAFVRRPTVPFRLIGSDDRSRLELDAFAVRIATNDEQGEPEISIELGAIEGLGGSFCLIVDVVDADAFASSVAAQNTREIRFPAALRWSSRSGFAFNSGSGMEIAIPINVASEAVSVDVVTLRMSRNSIGGATVSGGVDVRGKLGPVSASIKGLGLEFVLGQPATGQPSSFADIDMSLGLKRPTGVGLDINAGPISGGGFITFKDDRYAGALELRIYNVTVKAFGVIDTKLPGGAPGFSFVILISAEFQPIQLGLGFTLNGVGGLLGINRTLSEEGLNKAFAGKGLQQLLFPKNVTQDAPQIIEGLATVFPAAEDKQVFGPMAKLGWGSPNLVTADLALILSLPERVLTVLGIVDVALPRKREEEDRALVDLHLVVKGVLDFPKSSFSLDAGLTKDSTIGGFPVGGQMAMRLRWGDRPNFLLSMGGFNSAFRPPPDFPALQRMTIDLGIKGNPNITLAGYLAVTSNSVQVGGELDVSARDYGITLNAFLKAEAIFVFSPFSFTATIDAGVHVDFHGVGFSVGLHGRLSGPSPWRIDARVCASLWFVSACLPVRVTIGDERDEGLLPLNPWVGSVEPSAVKSVIGLKDALEDPRNWIPVPGSSTQGVISLAEAPKKAPGMPPTVLVDPLDAITVHQRVVPLETSDSAPIRRFGPVKSSGRPNFRLQQATMGTSETKLMARQNITDYFAPAQYFELGDAKAISGASFERFVAGYTLEVKDEMSEVGNETSLGSQETRDVVNVETFIIDSKTSARSDDIALSTEILTGMQAISPAALFGVVRKGANSYVDFAALRRFRYGDPRYVVTRKESGQPVGVMTGPASKAEALAALEYYLESHSFERGNLQVSRITGGVAP